MVDHDVFENGISNGDTLSDGYFNGLYEAMKNVSSGHDHDGTDSKQIADMSIGSGYCFFNTSSGHNHDGINSKQVIYGNLQIDSMAEDTSESTVTVNSYGGSDSTPDDIVKTYTFTPVSTNNTLLFMKIRFDYKNSTSALNGRIGITVFMKNNTTNKYVVLGDTGGINSDSRLFPTIISTSTNTAYADSGERIVNIIGAPLPGSQSQFGQASPAMALGSSYNIYIDGYRSYDSTSTSSVLSIRNVELTIGYIDNGKVNTTSTKFT